MKTSLLLAAGATAVLAFVLIKTYRHTDNTPFPEARPTAGEHHLTNVFAKAKKQSARATSY